MIGFALLLVFTPEIESLERLRYLNTYFMLGFLALGMAMLFVNENRMMFASLISCGILCIFLKSASNEHIVLPENNDLPSIEIAHFNLGNFSSHPDSLISLLNNSNADLVSFQEYTPAWDKVFANKFQKDYPYFSKDVRIDPYGICLFSVWIAFFFC